MAISAFLDKYFSEEKYHDLRESVKGFVEGYDAADSTLASAFALRDEWLSESDYKQYRIEGGYGKLIDFLMNESISSGANVHLSSVVREINWSRESVTAVTADQRSFRGKPRHHYAAMGVMQQHHNESGTITFVPGIPDKLKAIQSIGYGAVIKILLLFDEPFWEELNHKKHEKFGIYFFQTALFQTWWTQIAGKNSFANRLAGRTEG
jgi:monoamine oxidase